MSAVLPGAVVRGSDGQIVGRVRDIYLTDRTGELAAITVVDSQLASRNVLIPAAAIAELEHRKPHAADASEDSADGDAGSGTSADGDAGSESLADDTPHVQDTAVHLRVDSMTVRAGIAAPETGHATPQQLHLAARELGIEEAAAG